MFQNYYFEQPRCHLSHQSGRVGGVRRGHQKDQRLFSERRAVWKSVLVRLLRVQSCRRLRSGATAARGLLLRDSASLRMAAAAKKASQRSLRGSSARRARELSSRVCSWRTPVRKALKLSQNRAVRGALWESSGNLRLTARMTLMSLWRMNSRYSFSQCSAVAVRARRKSWWRRQVWYSSQAGSWKWFWPRSPSSRTTFSRNLNSASVSIPRVPSSTAKEEMFWIAQQHTPAYSSSTPNCSRFATIGFRAAFTSSRGLPQTEVSLDVALEPSLEASLEAELLVRLVREPSFLVRESSVGAPEDLRLTDSVDEQWFTEVPQEAWPCPWASSKPSSSSRPMRLASLTWQARVMNSAALGCLMALGSAISEQRRSASSFSESTSCGVRPTSISQRTMPMAQISDFNEQQFFLSDSGAMQSGVPTLTRSLKANLLFTAKPKSDSFHLFPARSTLAGLISLWMTPSAMRYRQALHSCAMISRALVSVSWRFCAIYSLRLPWGQYSRTRQQWWEVLMASRSLTTLSWSRPRCTAISSSSISMLLPRNFRRSITLIATRMCGRSTSTPLYTRLLKPLPSYSPLSYLQRPTRTSDSRSATAIGFSPVRVRGMVSRAPTRRFSFEKLRNIYYKIAGRAVKCAAEGSWLQGQGIGKRQLGAMEG